MIQIALKPATRLGLNTSAIIDVIDKRHNKFHDSLLGIVESTLCDGPIYFSCFPNFIISLKDPNLLHASCIDLKSDGFNTMKNTENVILIYRIYYKVTNTTFSNFTNIPTDNNSTTLFVTDIAKSNMVIPKTISWD